MATGDKLVKLDDLKLVYDKLHVPSVQLQITTGQWSGNGPYTYSANVTNIDANTSVEMEMDETIDYLTADLKVTTGSGSITLSTASKPSNTVNVTLFFPGVQSEVNVQVLADVYSKSQTDTLLAAKVSTSNIVNNLTSGGTAVPLSADMGKFLRNDASQAIARGAAIDVDTLYDENLRVAFYAAGYQSSHLPTSAWYFIIAFRAESTYISQLAIGMTESGVYYRRFSIGTVGAAWTKLG